MASAPANWVLLLILCGTFLIFSPSLQNEFVNWDDDRNLYENEAVLNLNWENTVEIFTTDVIGNYNPLSNFVLAVEHALFKDTEYYHAAFHLVNLLLHLLCIWLIFKILVAMSFSKTSVVITTALFAIYPLRVESVTWITEIKDVLYGSFFFGSMYMYQRYLEKNRNKHVWWAWILFIIGLFAKIQMVILPVVLVLLDYWKGRTDMFRSALKKWPFFLPAFAFGLVGIFLLGDKGSLETSNTYPPLQRIFIGTYSLTVYLIKSVVPYRMSPLYPYPGALTLWHYLSVVPALLFLLGLAWSWIREKKILFFGLAFFFFNVVMLLQILGAGQGYLADRFTYVAYLGLFIIYGHYLGEWMKMPQWKTVITAGVIAVIGIYSWLTFAQTKIWKNSGTLWTHVLKHYTKSTLPYGNRANYYRDIGEIELALSDYSSTIRLAPNDPKPYNSRAKLYFARNQDAQALQDYIKAIELDPDNAEYLINRGAAYAKMGDWSKALSDLNKGLELNPQNINGYLNRSLVYQNVGQLEKSIQDLYSYLDLDPDNSDIWFEVARLHQILSQHQKALTAFERAISMNPKGVYFMARSKTYFQLNRLQECREDLISAQRSGIQPDKDYLKLLREENIM